MYSELWSSLLHAFYPFLVLELGSNATEVTVISTNNI